MPKTQPQKIEKILLDYIRRTLTDGENKPLVRRGIRKQAIEEIRQLLKSEKEEFENVIEGWLKYESTELNGSCGACGGKLIEIRGRYPKEPKRKVCPTCLMEIREGAISNFGSEAGEEEIK